MSFRRWEPLALEKIFAVALVGFQFDDKVNLLFDFVAFLAQDDDRSLCRSPDNEVAVIFGAKLHTNDAEVDFMGTKAAELVPVERRATAVCGRIANIHQRKGRAEKERVRFGDHDTATRRERR